MKKWTQKGTKKYGWTYAALDYYIHDVWMYAAKKKGCMAADRITAPLEYWIKTGRASLAECKALIEKKPYIIGRILMEHENENYDDILDAVKKKIGCEIV